VQYSTVNFSDCKSCPDAKICELPNNCYSTPSDSVVVSRTAVQ